MREKAALAGGALLAALAASACCIGPVLLAALGIGSIGTGSALAQYRPYFLGLALFLVGLALWRAYRKDAGCCATVAGRRMQRLTRFFLWAITGVTLTLLMYPNIAAHERTSRPKSAAEMTGHSAAYAIPSMDCPACATIIEKRLQEKPGILFAHVDFAAKRAVIRFNPQEVTPGYIRTVIEETGLPARLIKVVGQEQKSD